MLPHMPDNVDPLEKAETRTLSLPRGDWESLAERGRATGGDRSKYVRSLLQKDRNAVDAAPDAIAPNILVDLCRRLRPELALDLEKCIAQRDAAVDKRDQGAPGLSQPRVLAALLEALLTSLAGVPLPSYERPLALADRELLDAVVRSVYIGDQELAVALVTHAFDFGSVARRMIAHSNRPTDAETFCRRWRAELGLPYVTPLQAVAESGSAGPTRPPKPQSTGSTP